MEITKDEQQALSNVESLLRSAQDKSARLHDSHTKVTAKIEQLNTEAADAVAAAKDGEQQAANAVAEAIAQGADNSSIQKAEKALEAAAAAVTKARESQQQGSAMRDALEVQANSLAAQIEQADNELRAVETKANGVRSAILKRQWNAALDVLQEVGSDLVMLLPERGWYSMRDMKVPRYALEPGQPDSSLIRDDLLRLAGGSPAVLS